MLGNIFQPRRAYSTSYSGTRRLTTTGAFTRKSSKSSGKKRVVAVMMYRPKPIEGARSIALKNWLDSSHCSNLSFGGKSSIDLLQKSNTPM
jgi:hypothetical protein